jgi:carbon monoxide dehydrogenase subunit G
MRDVSKNKQLSYGGKIFGIVDFQASVKLTPLDEGKTKVDYTFHMTGCIGSLFSKYNAAAIVGGTEKGLANIVQLSETAQN